MAHAALAHQRQCQARVEMKRQFLSRASSLVTLSKSGIDPKVHSIEIFCLGFKTASLTGKKIIIGRCSVTEPRHIKE